MATQARAVSTRRIAVYALIWSFAVLSFAALATVASAQQPAGNGPAGNGYEELPVHPSWTENKGRKLRDTRRAVISLLRETGSAATDPQGLNQLKEYYGTYVLPKMTQSGNLDELPELRNDLVSDIVNARSPELRQEMIRLAGRMSVQLVTKNYHPAVRANGAFLMGQIDQQSYSRDRPPQPLSAARGILIRWYNDANMPESVRVASLMGLVRHARLIGPFLPDADKTNIATILLSIVKEPVPEGREAAAHGFLQRTAMETMLKLQRGTDLQLVNDARTAELYQAAADLAANPEAPVIGRLRAAALLGELPKPDNFNGTPEQQAAQWASLLAASFDDAAERIRRRLAPKAKSTTGGYGDMEAMYGEYEESGFEDSMDMAYGFAPAVEEETFEPQPPLIVALRRRLNHHLELKHRGIDGVATGQAENSQTGLASWSQDALNGLPGKLREAIVKSQERVNDREVYELEPYLELLEEQVEMMQAVAAAGGVGEAVEEAAPGEQPAEPGLDLGVEIDPEVAAVNP